MLEPDSVVKENCDYRFALIPTDECELLSYTCDEKPGPLDYETTPDESNIICEKFTEYLTVGMVARLSNQLYIGEEQLKIKKLKK